MVIGAGSETRSLPPQDVQLIAAFPQPNANLPVVHSPPVEGLQRHHWTPPPFTWASCSLCSRTRTIRAQPSVWLGGLPSDLD